MPNLLRRKLQQLKRGDKTLDKTCIYAQKDGRLLILAVLQKESLRFR